jgi:hypothetical protein
MRRSLVLGALWVAAAALAAGVAWAGIGVVGDQVTDERPQPLSASQVDQAVAADQAGTAATTDGAEGTPPSTSSPPDDVQATTLTRPVGGGVVTLRFAPSGVTVLGASPNEGFVVESQPDRGNGVRVEFESEDHESRVVAWWDGGPQVEVREDGQDVEDDGDDDGGRGRG